MLRRVASTTFFAGNDIEVIGAVLSGGGEGDPRCLSAAGSHVRGEGCDLNE